MGERLGHGEAAHGKAAHGKAATERCTAQWLAAMRWRRGVEQALAAVGLTFTQWQILDAIRRLIAETEDAVNQNEIAAEVELDRSTVSQVMRTLEQKQLVDRGPSATGLAWRVFLTRRAIRLLNEHRSKLEAVSVSSGPAL